MLVERNTLLLSLEAQSLSLSSLPPASGRKVCTDMMSTIPFSSPAYMPMLFTGNLLHGNSLLSLWGEGNSLSFVEEEKG